MDGNLNEDLDENHPWLTQKTEDPTSNKGNLTFPHTQYINVIELNCKVIKKVAIPSPPISTSTPPPLFQVYPPFLGKNFVPPLPRDSIFRRSYTTLPPFNKGGRGPTMLTMTPVSVCQSQSKLSKVIQSQSYLSHS